MRGKVLTLLTLMAVLAGCGKQKATSSSIAQDPANIINGSDVVSPNEYSRYTVYIYSQADGFESCTGSIYDSQTILTAAHCMVDMREARVVFATDAQDLHSVKPENFRAVDGVVIHPGYRAQDPDTEQVNTEAEDNSEMPTVDEVAEDFEKNNLILNDVALVHFSGGLPDGYAPVKLATSEALKQPGDLLHMVGYGVSEVNSALIIVNGHGALRPEPNKATRGQLRETQLALARYSAKVKMIFSTATTTGVCNGDSGGPAFVKDASTGEIVQVGIAEAVANAYCNSVAMHTAVFPYLNWIQNNASKLSEKVQAQLTLNTLAL